MTEDRDPGQDAALVLFSGGQDSATCLAWALARFARVETIGFDYGQRHRVELECRTRIAERLKANFPEWGAKLSEDHLVDLSVLGRLSDTALTRHAEIAFAESGLPNTFVPGRNLVFLTYAAAVADRRGLAHLVGGMCETDFSGYPDCRRQTMDAMDQTLRLGMDRPFVIDTPLMALTKADTWALAKRLGGEALVEIILEHSHTCYLGERAERHAFGYGCGHCPACELRAHGWDAWTSAGRKALAA